MRVTTGEKPVAEYVNPFPGNKRHHGGRPRRVRRRRHPEPNAEVVVKGRNVEVPDHFRIYVSEKLSRLERFDRTIYLFDVELDHERNRRQRKNCQHVEITARGRGPVVRGEACADSFYAALESAAGKLESRLRKQQGPPQDPLWGQNPGLAGRSDGTRDAFRDPAVGDGRHPAGRRVSTTMSRAGSCGPRNTRRSR